MSHHATTPQRHTQYQAPSPEPTKNIPPRAFERGCGTQLASVTLWGFRDPTAYTPLIRRITSNLRFVRREDQQSIPQTTSGVTLHDHVGYS